MHKRVRVVLLALLLLALTAGVVLSGRALWQAAHESRLESALEVVPAKTLRFGFTDWAEVRRITDVSTSTDPATAEELDAAAFERDLQPVSSISESGRALQEHFGFSPSTAEWEGFAVAREGASMALRMPDDFDFERVRANLEDLGFTRPDSKDGVWDGGVDLVAALDPTLSPELQYIAVLEDEHLIVSSDTPEYAEVAVEAALGDARSLADVEGARDLAGPAESPVAARLWSRDFACEDLSMAAADQQDQQRADELVAAAGGVSPVTGLLISSGAEGSITVVAGFESDDQARDNLEPRAKLAVGEAVGRGGDFGADYELTRSRTDGSQVVLTLKPRDGSDFPLSGIITGPVLFATC